MYQNDLDFICDYCSRSFTRKYNLLTHIQKCHINSTTHCDICGHSSGSPADLQLHLSRGHNSHGQSLLECDICGRIFMRKQNITSHMIMIHLRRLPDDIRCTLCRKSFSSEGSLKRHINQFHEPNVDDTLTCHLCNKVYMNTRNLKRHLESHGEKGEYKCDICPKVYTTNQSLKRHLRTMHSGDSHGEFSCSICGKIIIGKDNYDSHVQVYHSEKENVRNDIGVLCETCHFACETESELRQHIKNLHSFEIFYKYCKKALLKHQESDYLNNVYNCEYCHQGFPSVYTLKDHMRVNHDTEYALSTCNICFSKFYCRETMNAHKRVCKPPPNVNSCKHCDKLFTDISSLEFHTRIFHPQAQIADSNIIISSTNKDEDVSTPFKCLHCDRMYYSDRSLKHHMKLKHTSNEQVKCDICNKICSNKYYLASHIKIVHDNDSWSQCEYCDKYFKSKRNIRHHMEYTHLGMQRYKCVECETLFKEKRSLRKHVRIKHPNSNVFPQCHICHKRFESAKSCKIHLKLLHSFNMNTHPCHLCSVSFNSNESLSIHLSTKHLAEDEIYKCETCNLVFNGQDKFDKHKETCKRNLVSNSKTKLSPRCILCMKDFSTRKTLKRHIKKFHCEFNIDELATLGSQVSTYNIDCEECVKNFNSDFHYGVYQKVKHIQDSVVFKCEFCHVSYNCIKYAVQRYKVMNSKTKAVLSELCTTEMSEEEPPFNGFGSLHQLPESTTNEMTIKSEPVEDFTNDEIKMEPASP